MPTENNSDIKNKGSSLSTTEPEVSDMTETSYCNETSSIQGTSMKKSGQPTKNLTVLENQSEEFSNGPRRNRVILMSNDKSYQKKLVSWNCKQNLLDISLFKNPFFYIFTWSFLLSQIAYFIPTFHLVARAKTLGIDVMDASYLVSIAGKKIYFKPSTWIKFYFKTEGRRERTEKARAAMSGLGKARESKFRLSTPCISSCTSVNCYLADLSGPNALYSFLGV